MASRAARSPEATSSARKKNTELRADVVAAAPVLDADSPAGIDDWITRGEVAELMRVSITTVRRLQGRDLHPRRSAEGVFLFDPREVEEVRARRPPPPEEVQCLGPGELAAAAFKLFRDGVDVRDAVIALQRLPTEVEALYADWERLGDMLFVSRHVRFILGRMVNDELLDTRILDGIEDNDADALYEFVSNA